MPGLYEYRHPCQEPTNLPRMPYDAADPSPDTSIPPPLRKSMPVSCLGDREFHLEWMISLSLLLLFAPTENRYFGSKKALYYPIPVSSCRSSSFNRHIAILPGVRVVALRIGVRGRWSVAVNCWLSMDGVVVMEVVVSVSSSLIRAGGAATRCFRLSTATAGRHAVSAALAASSSPKASL